MEDYQTLHTLADAYYVSSRAFNPCMVSWHMRFVQPFRYLKFNLARLMVEENVEAALY
jgi:hypothetical protein